MRKLGADADGMGGTGNHARQRSHGVPRLRGWGVLSVGRASVAAAVIMAMAGMFLGGKAAGRMACGAILVFRRDQAHGTCGIHQKCKTKKNVGYVLHRLSLPALKLEVNKDTLRRTKKFKKALKKRPSN